VQVHVQVLDSEAPDDRRRVRRPRRAAGGTAHEGGERRAVDRVAGCAAHGDGEGRASEHGAEDRQGAGRRGLRGGPASAARRRAKGSSDLWQRVSCGDERTAQEKKKAGKSIDLIATRTTSI
jgi:hypothetical protein